MAALTPAPRVSDPKARAAAVALSARLGKCWAQDLNWDLFPDRLRQVCCGVTFLSVYGSPALTFA